MNKKTSILAGVCYDHGMPKGEYNPPTFEGRPCRRCGSSTRYVNGAQRCVPCNRRYIVQHHATATERDALRGQPCVLCDAPMEQPCFDETDGRLRGWLCHDCNKGLGWFRERPWLLHRAARYVEEFARTGRQVTGELLDEGEETEEGSG